MQSKTAGMTLDELLYSEIDLFSEREEVIYFYLAETWRTEYVLLTKDIDMAELRRSVGEPILQIHANLAECSTLQSFLTETVFYDGEAYRYRLRKDVFYREEVEDVCSEDFYGFRLVILEGVDAIGDGAFAGSCFSEVQMSDDVLSIGAGAFRECRFLRSARFSERLEEVGEGAFSGCLRLESISVEKNDPNYASVNGVLFALEGEEATLLCFPSGYEGDYSVPTSLRWGGRRYAVTAIAEGAFENAVGLDSLKIPEGVEQRQRGR